MAISPTAASPAPEPLGLEVLSDTARRLARGPRPYLELERGATRAYRQLRDEPLVNAWLIRWADEADTGFHDHDASSGAVHVIEGRVVEERLTVGGGHVTNVYGPGDTFTFEASDIHRVTLSGCDEALTVHAYSPALERMGAYLVEPGGRLRRFSIPASEELRPVG